MPSSETQDRLTKARKEHVCELCREKINKEERYHRQNVTPWDHQDNECFFTFKAHAKCYEIWCKIGHEYDWLFPEDRADWDEMTEGLTPETGHDLQD